MTMQTTLRAHRRTITAGLMALILLACALLIITLTASPNDDETGDPATTAPGSATTTEPPTASTSEPAPATTDPAAVTSAPPDTETSVPATVGVPQVPPTDTPVVTEPSAVPTPATTPSALPTPVTTITTQPPAPAPTTQPPAPTTQPPPTTGPGNYTIDWASALPAPPEPSRLGSSANTAKTYNVARQYDGSDVSGTLQRVANVYAAAGWVVTPDGGGADAASYKLELNNLTGKISGKTNTAGDRVVVTWELLATGPQA